MIRPLHRNYELAWDIPDEERERFRRIIIATLVIAVALCILFPLLPTPKRTQTAVVELGFNLD